MQLVNCQWLIEIGGGGQSLPKHEAHSYVSSGSGGLIATTTTLLWFFLPFHCILSKKFYISLHFDLLSEEYVINCNSSNDDSIEMRKSPGKARWVNHNLVRNSTCSVPLIRCWTFLHLTAYQLPTTYVLGWETFLFHPAYPRGVMLGALLGIPTELWHLPQVVPRVVQTTDFMHPQPTLPNC